MVARQLHAQICAKVKISMPNWNKPCPALLECEHEQIYWAPSYHDTGVNKCCPDLVWIREKCGYIIEVTVAWPAKLNEAYERKFSKYAINGMREDNEPLPAPRGKNLVTELSIALKKPFSTIPVVIGVAGEVTPQVRQNLRTMGFSAKDCDTIISKLSRSAVLGTSLVLRAHLAASRVLH